MNNKTKIVVSGYSAITAAGIGIEPILKALREGVSALTDIPLDISGGIELKWGRADFFKGSEFMPPLKARKLDRSSQLTTATAGLALKHAGIDTKSLDPERIGIAMGCGFGGVGNSAEFLTGYFNSGAEGMSPMLFPNTVSNASASNASIEHGLKGPNVTMVQRFCSAESAFMMACQFIEDGRADIMLVGGIDEMNPLMLKGFISLGQHKSFARFLGEGCGILILESAESAARRNAVIHAAVQDVRTIGMLPANMESEGCRILLGNCSDITRIGLSGTAIETPALVSLLPECKRMKIAPVVGRSLGMGATAMAVLIALLNTSENGMHLAASPEGPYFSIRFQGGSSAYV